MKKLAVLLFIFLVNYFVKAQDTFSIIAVDPVTGEVGSAGASCVSGAGSVFDTWITDIIPGKGGVNSQAWICIPNTNLQNAIDRMEEGLTPQEIIDWLLLNDSCNSQNFDPEYRQYGIVDLDVNGDPRTAGWTGSMADDYKEDRQGANYSIQGNILLDISVIDNMESNFNNTAGTLADKLMAALQGANFPGADSRCLDDGTSSRAAYIIVYKADDTSGDPYLRLVVPSQALGTEPIDILQDLYNDFLSVEENVLKSRVQIYPNPATDELIVSYDSTISIKRMEVFDINGKLISQINEFPSGTIQFNLDVSSFQNGIYFLNIESLQGNITLKFVKK